MKFCFRIPLIAAAAALATPAFASEAIMKKARCVACHAVDGKRVGPGFRDVAVRYRGQADAPAKLAAKVRAGGAGVWGTVPMIPHPADKISDADLEAVVDWVLHLEKPGVALQ